MAKVVALGRTPQDITGFAKRFADLAGLAPAEARMRVAGEPPHLLVRWDDEKAEALCATLRSAGEQAIACPLPPPGDAERLVCRTFQLGADAIELSARLGPPVSFPHAGLRLLLRGLRVHHESSVRVEKERKFSLGKAIATQGLMLTSEKKREVKTDIEEAEGFLLIYSTAGVAALYEGEVAFTSLGADVRPSRHENLDLVARRLRERAPHAVWDDRLIRLGKRIAPFEPGRSVDLYAEILHQALAPG
ncbi:MAG: hypothetical protein ACYCWW_14270 [Deltaproteobacteria bacterium]